MKSLVTIEKKKWIWHSITSKVKDNEILYNDMFRTNSEDEWEGMVTTIKACV